MVLQALKNVSFDAVLDTFGIVRECPDAFREDLDSPSASVRRRFGEPDGFIDADNYNATIYIGVGSAVDQHLRAFIWTSFPHGRGQWYGHRPVRPSRAGGKSCPSGRKYQYFDNRNHEWRGAV